MTGRLILVAVGLGAALVSIALVLATHFISGNPGTIPLEWQWNLRWEHNVAAWWSGSLLALAAILTLDNALDAPTMAVRRAWITLGLIILFLALDEVGSLHERMGSVSKSLDAGRWALAIPLALVIAYLSIRSGLALLRRGGRARLQIVILGIGFAVLLSVALQEYIEKTFVWDGSEWETLRAAVEEGSELVGIAIVLMAVGIPLWQEPQKAFRALTAFAKPFTIGALILLLPLLAISLDDNPSKGDPSDWLASALFLGAALAWARRSWADRAADGAVPGALAVAIMAVLASAASVALGPTESFAIGDIDLNRRGVVYIVLGVSLIVVAGKTAGFPLLIGAGLVMLSQAPFWFASAAWPYLLGPICGLAAFLPSARQPSGWRSAQNGISSSRSS